jgi:tRNA dimethylallyltransferase
MSGPSRSERAERPLVILGPTASGKSDLALGIAESLGDVELVSIDSMQVYRGMNVGTATPTAAEQARVRHHLIDLVEPTEAFTVGEFQRRARAALADIRARGKTPVLVGGTGLYLRSVIDDLELPGQFPDAVAELEKEARTETLHARLATLDPVGAARMEPNNRRRVLRALEVTLGSGRPFSSFGPGMEHYAPTPFVQIALRWPREIINERIEARYERQLAEGFLDEVKVLAERGPSVTATQALGYRELLEHIDGGCSLGGAIEAAIVRTRRFARRQDRWFRRDPRLIWVDMPTTVGDVIAAWDDVLAKDAA